MLPLKMKGIYSKSKISDINSIHWSKIVAFEGLYV